MSIARTISDSIFYVSVGTYSLSEQSRKKHLNHVALIALDAGREHMSLACVQTFPLFLLLHREKGQFKNTRRRLHAGWYFPSNLFTLHFYFLQEAIAYFPLMILVSGILMSQGRSQEFSKGGSQRLLTRLYMVYTAALSRVSAGSVVLSRHEGPY